MPSTPPDPDAPVADAASVVTTATLTLAAWLVSAAVCDLTRRRLPNALMLAGLAAAGLALLGSAQPLGLDALAAAGGGLAGLALTLPFYRLRWLGGGDVKFLPIVGLWFGQHLAWIWILGSIMLGLHAVAASRTARAPASPRSLPYGGHMAIAALVVLALQSPRPPA